MIWVIWRRHWNTCSRPRNCFLAQEPRVLNPFRDRPQGSARTILCAARFTDNVVSMPMPVAEHRVDGAGGLRLSQQNLHKSSQVSEQRWFGRTHRQQNPELF